MKAAIYTRVSTSEQDTSRQTFDLRRYAEARGWEVAVEKSDRLSGASDRRPGYQAVMAAAKRREIDVVVVHKLDRWGRSMKHLVESLVELEALGVKFVSMGDGFDLSTPNGRMLAHLLSAFAEFERSMISERIRSGLAQARRNGKRLGRPGIGIDRKKLARMVKEKTPLREMARRLGCSRTAVRSALRG